MEEIRFDPETDFAYLAKHSDEPFGGKERRMLFEKHKGGIQINYLGLDGDLWPIDKSKSSSRINNQPYSRLRLFPVKGDQKYRSAIGIENRPYLTRRVVEKYKQEEEINTLVIVEGEFKAFLGAKLGLDVIGIPGIWMWKEREKKSLHPTVLAIIEKCQVKNCILLFDADCFSITPEPGKDLFKRPNSFYSSVKGFREAIKGLNCDAYFSHIKEEYIKNGKGLDDLLNLCSPGEEEIIEDLEKLELGTVYFNTYNISDLSLLKLKRIFSIDSPQSFYAKYSEVLDEEKFIFKGGTYQYVNGELEQKRHPDAELYKRVGTTYIKTVKVPNQHGEFEEIDIKWKKGEIITDYKQEKGIKNFIQQIPKYDSFCNIPDHTDSYKRVHGRCYNLYKPLKHIPKEGSFSNIMAFLKHIFGNGDMGKVGEPLAVAMDYLTIVYRQPTQILPILCLVSSDNNTGKSTFLKLLKDIYHENATILGNEQFSKSFNAHYILKLIIAIDESFIAVDKKHIKERIKQLVTSDRQHLEYKGVDAQEVDFFGKLIMCSNDENNFVAIDEGEIRWWVIKVHPIQGNEDPDLRQKMKEEIPAFLHFLANRKITHPKESRAWFNPKYLETDQLKKVIRNTQTALAKDIEEWVTDTLLTYNLEKVEIDPKRLKERLDETGRFKYSAADIRSYLKNRKKMEPSPKTVLMKIPLDHTPDGSVIYADCRGRPFTFHREDWVQE